MLTKMASNSLGKEYTCLCLPNAGTEGVTPSFVLLWVQDLTKLPGLALTSDFVLKVLLPPVVEELESKACAIRPTVLRSS